MHTLVHRPAKTTRPLPISLTRLAMRASSHVFIVVRSMTSTFGNTGRISSYIGPEKVFSATIFRIVGTLNSPAAFSPSTQLFRTITAAIDLVPDDILYFLA